MQLATAFAVVLALGSIVAAGGCAGPPKAALSGLGTLDPEAARWLPPEQRLAVTLAHGCESDDAIACEKLGSLYFIGRGVPKHPFHALSLWSYACDQGVAIACEQAADELVSGVRLPRDLGHAVTLYDAGCSRGRASACTSVGELFTTGRYFTPVPRRAARAFRKGCDKGDAAGCYSLALAMLAGRGVAHDADAAVALLQRSCTAEHASSCRQLATLHATGSFVARDPVAALAYERRACTAGLGASCTDLGLRALDEGRTPEALADLEAACEVGDVRGCALAGDVFASHEPPDLARAGESYARACQGGLWEACGRVAVLEGAGGIDDVRLRQLYDLACDADVMPACDYLAGMMLDGIGGPADGPGAARLYDRACERDVASSCLHLAWMGRSDGGSEPLGWLERACELDPLACVVLGEVHELGLVAGGVVKRAAEAYQRGCAADDAGACEKLASLYFRGHGVERDDAVAARLFSVACDGGRGEACAELGFMHERGLGVSADATWAGHYRDRACKLGFTPACDTATVQVGQAGNATAPKSVESP